MYSLFFASPNVHDIVVVAQHVELVAHGREVGADADALQLPLDLAVVEEEIQNRYPELHRQKNTSAHNRIRRGADTSVWEGP